MAGTYDDFISAFMHDPNTFDYDSFRAQAQKAHEDDLSIRDAKIAQQASETDSYRAEVARLKAANYDLLMSKPAEQPKDAAGAAGPETEVPEVTEADLFKPVPPKG